MMSDSMCDQPPDKPNPAFTYQYDILSGGTA